MARSLIDTIEETEGLPAMPDVVARAFAIARDETAGVAELERVVSRDEALAAAVVRRGNSAALGVPGRTLDLPRCLARLGRRGALAVIVEQNVSPMLDDAGEAYGLRRRALWRSALFGALAAERLAPRASGVDPGEAYVAALLRDVGKLAVEAHLRETGRYDVLDVACGDGSFLGAERGAFGVDHAEAGALLAAKWGMPGRIQGAIRFHHGPPEGDGHDALFDVVHAADVLCLGTGLGAGHDGLRYTLAPHVRRTLLPSLSVVESVTASSMEALQGVESEFGGTEGRTL